MSAINWSLGLLRIGVVLVIFWLLWADGERIFKSLGDATAAYSSTQKTLLLVLIAIFIGGLLAWVIWGFARGMRRGFLRIGTALFALWLTWTDGERIVRSLGDPMSVFSSTQQALVLTLAALFGGGLLSWAIWGFKQRKR